MSNLQLKQHFEELISLSDEEFEIVASCLQKRILKRRRFLIQPGDKVLHTFWVKKGLLIASYHDESGKEHIIQFAMENWWITDYPAYFSQTSATMSIECLEDCELFALSYTDREKLCADFHMIEFFFRKKANSGYV